MVFLVNRFALYVAHVRRTADLVIPQVISWRCFSDKGINMNVADLSDAYDDILQYVEPGFKNYGGKLKFGGMISTVKCHEDNVLVKQALSEPGGNRVRDTCSKLAARYVWSLDR